MYQLLDAMRLEIDLSCLYQFSQSFFIEVKTRCIFCCLIKIKLKFLNFQYKNRLQILEGHIQLYFYCFRSIRLSGRILSTIRLDSRIPEKGAGYQPDIRYIPNRLNSNIQLVFFSLFTRRVLLSQYYYAVGRAPPKSSSPNQRSSSPCLMFIFELLLLLFLYSEV